MEPVVTLVLDVSTKHITKQDVTILERQAWCKEHREDPPMRHIVAAEDQYSWWVWAGDIHEESSIEERVGEAEDEGFTSYFTNILRVAHKHQCPFVRFDHDGTVYEKLSIADW